MSASFVRTAPTKKAVLYLRVSTEEQVDNFSLGTQQEICTKDANRRDIEVIKIFREEGKSAKTISGRPVLLELLEYCRKNKKEIDTVIVYRLDRISRQTADYLVIRKKLTECGIVLLSATEPTGNSPTEKLMETIIASFAQHDNEVRGERTKNGLRARFVAGLSHGTVPLGYISDHGYTIKDPESFGLIQKGWELMATGTKSLNEMAEVMNSWGVRQQLKGEKHLLRVQAVSRLFKNKFYAGILTSKRYPDEVRGQHPAMISLDQYYQVQAIVEGRTTNTPVQLAKKNRNNPEFPLRRIVMCNKCGAPFTGAWSKGKRTKYAYYFCRNRCGCSSVSVDTLEGDTATYMSKISPKPEALELFITILRKMYLGRIKTVQKRKEAADQELADVYTLRQTLIEKNLRGIYSDEIFQEQNKVLEERITLARLSKSDALLEKYNLEELVAFVKSKFSDLAITYKTSRLCAKRVLMCSIFPSGMAWDYPGFSNTEISLNYQYITNPETLELTPGESGGNRTHDILLKREAL